MGKSRSSGGGSTTVQISPEEREYLKAQTDFFKNTLAPTYESTVGGARGAYEGALGGVQDFARAGQAAAGGVGALLGSQGAQAYQTGLAGLSNLFSDQYKQQQLEAALQPGRETYEQDLAQLGTQFGGAGGLGSARSALAGTNLASLNAQRQGTVAANVLGGIEDRRAAAANQLAGYGQEGLGGAINALSAGQQFAQSPLDLYSKYAGIVYGVPGASVSPNFQGTRSSTTTQQSRGKTKGG